MRIKITDERRTRLLGAIRDYFRDNLDQDLGEFGAERLLDFFIVELGAPVYNQAIRDAHGFLQEKLVDLEGEFYEPEPEQRGR